MMLHTGNLFTKRNNDYNLIADINFEKHIGFHPRSFTLEITDQAARPQGPILIIYFFSSTDPSQSVT